MINLKRSLTPPLIILAALAMACEEWLWERLKLVTGWLARFPLIHWYESAILRLPPYPTMIVFLLPGLMLLPVKLLAVYWLAEGYWLASVATIVCAKVVGTAFAARSYVICQPKLMTIGWFRRLHDWLIATRDKLYAAIRAMPLYQRIHAQYVAAKQAIRRLVIFIKQKNGRGLCFRWRAIRRWRRGQRRQHDRQPESCGYSK